LKIKSKECNIFPDSGTNAGLIFVKEEYHKWDSIYLNREFEMLVFGHSGFPVILFPTAKGRYFQAKDNGLIESASFFLDCGLIKIYTPDSFDQSSWYNFSAPPYERVKAQMAYENSILLDVIDFARHETEKDKVILAGCDFGAYHAANISFRHPDIVSHLFCMSGIFDIKQFIYGYYDDDCYFNNPPDYMTNLEDDWYLSRIRKIAIALGTGQNDSKLGENIRLSNILSRKGISHWLDNRQGFGNDWFWWKQLFPHYLSLIKE
jgi:esterase/lipase superfamily enzyme